MYTVFTRNWYKKQNGKLIPHMGRRTILESGIGSKEKAVEMCTEWNEKNPSGELRRKAEFTSNY